MTRALLFVVVVAGLCLALSLAAPAPAPPKQQAPQQQSGLDVAKLAASLFERMTVLARALVHEAVARGQELVGRVGATAQGLLKGGFDIERLRKVVLTADSAAIVQVITAPDVLFLARVTATIGRTASVLAASRARLGYSWQYVLGATLLSEAVGPALLDLVLRRPLSLLDGDLLVFTAVVALATLILRLNTLTGVFRVPMTLLRAVSWASGLVAASRAAKQVYGEDAIVQIFVVGLIALAPRALPLESLVADRSRVSYSAMQVPLVAPVVLALLPRLGLGENESFIVLAAVILAGLLFPSLRLTLPVDAVLSLLTPSSAAAAAAVEAPVLLKKEAKAQEVRSPGKGKGKGQ